MGFGTSVELNVYQVTVIFALAPIGPSIQTGHVTVVKGLV